MTNLELIDLFSECVDLLLLNGIPLPINQIDTKIHLTHKSSYFGVCRKKFVNGAYLYTIGLNSNFVKFGSYKGIKNTILHELCHTLPDTKNHNKVWQMWAKKISSLSGCNIQRMGGDKTETDNNTLKLKDYD